MNTPDFNWTHAKWDEFKKFHTNQDTLFVKFDDGGFMVRNHTLHPRRRAKYDALNIKIMRANDERGLKFSKPDGSVVMAKSLRNCLLLWDLETDQAYSLDAMWAPRRFNSTTRMLENLYGPHACDMLPHYLQLDTNKVRFFKYADGRIVSMPIDIQVRKKYEPEQETYIRTTINACKAWYAMIDDKISPLQCRRQKVDAYGWKAFANLTAQERTSIALFGFTDEFEHEHVPYLNVKKKTT